MNGAATVDLLVIGGGIAGVSIAREAALRGLHVTLVEKDDLASGTSGRSTKLLHGGLRYLESGHLALVREALREREITARLAPHLARALPFALLTRDGVFPGPFAARAGVALYGLLAGSNPLGERGFAARGRIASAVGGLTEDPFSGASLFFDRQTDDARLTLAIGRDAARRGATIRTRCEVVELIDARGRVAGARLIDRERSRREDILALLVVNATGPWTDGLRGLAGASDPAIRPSRGSHIVLPDLGLRRAVLFSGEAKGHRLFAIPWRGATLVGTTDDDDRSGPDRVEPTEADVATLLREARRLFPHAALGRESILSSFAGLRPLVAATGSTRAASREHRILDDRGMLSLVGGKLTTWRSMAEEVAILAVRRLGRGRLRAPESRTVHLPGGAAGAHAEDPRLAHLPRDVALHLAAQYGSEAPELAALALERPDLAERLAPDRPEISAQVEFATRREGALDEDDVLLRRLPIGHDPAAVAAARPMVREVLRRASRSKPLGALS